MLLKVIIVHKVKTVQYSKCLRLLRWLVADFKSKFACGEMVSQQSALNFSSRACEDLSTGIDCLEIQIRHIRVTTKKNIEDVKRRGVLLRAFANGSELQKKVGYHVNQYWDELFNTTALERVHGLDGHHHAWHVMLNLKPPETSCASCGAPVEREKRPRYDSDLWTLLDALMNIVVWRYWVITRLSSIG